MNRFHGSTHIISLLIESTRTGSKVPGMSNDKRPDTRIIDGGRRRDWRGQLVNVPISRASTILLRFGCEEYEGRIAASARERRFLDSRERRRIGRFWEALTEIEPGAAGTALTSSGPAAVTAALTAVLSAGDDLLMVDSVYGPTRRYCDEIIGRCGISVRYYDPLATPEQVEALLQPGPRLSS